MLVVQKYDNAIFALIILQFCYRIILQDKLPTFNIQDNRSKLFPPTTNYKNDNNIKRFYIDNIIGDELLLNFGAKFQR